MKTHIIQPFNARAHAGFIFLSYSAQKNRPMVTGGVIGIFALEINISYEPSPPNYNQESYECKNSILGSSSLGFQAPLRLLDIARECVLEGPDLRPYSSLSTTYLMVPVLSLHIDR